MSHHPVESQDHQPTAHFDMWHLNNGTIFLYLCVFVVPLSGHKRLLHHLALILKPLLILCRGVFHSRLDTYLFSKRFPLQPSLIHGLLSRILTCRCMEASDVVGVRISTYPVLTYLLTYLPARVCCCHFITMVVILLLIPVQYPSLTMLLGLYVMYISIPYNTGHTDRW